MPRKATRNAQGGGSLRKLKNGLWEARYTVGRDPGTGKQVQKSVYAKTQDEARKKLAQATTAIDEGTYIEPSKLTVGAWLDIWLDEYNKNVKPRTLNLYRGQCNHRIKPAIGAKKLSSLTPPDIQKFLNAQEKTTATMQALSPKSIKNLHGILRKALQQAVSIGYIKTNPATASKLPRIEKADIKPLDSEKISAFLKAVKGHKFELLYVIDLFTGMRQSEIIGLTWDCVQEDSIYVYRQLQRIDGEYQFTPLKNDKTRTITPAASIMAMLHEHKIKQEEQRKLLGTVWSNEENFVFTNEVGRHLIFYTVYENFKRIVDGMGIPSTRFHDLRHSYAVAALQSGDDMKTLQENLGHHAAAFTLDVYGHVTDQMKLQSAARMDNFFKQVYEGQKPVKGKLKGNRLNLSKKNPRKR